MNGKDGTTVFLPLDSRINGQGRNNHYLLESIAACDIRIANLVMYFTINMAFTNYLNMLPNLTNSLPLIKDRTKYEQALSLNLSIPDFDSSLKHVPTSWKNFMHIYANNKEFFLSETKACIYS